MRERMVKREDEWDDSDDIDDELVNTTALVRLSCAIVVFTTIAPPCDGIIRVIKLI